MAKPRDLSSIPPSQDQKVRWNCLRCDNTGYRVELRVVWEKPREGMPPEKCWQRVADRERAAGLMVELSGEGNAGRRLRQLRGLVHVPDRKEGRSEGQGGSRRASAGRQTNAAQLGARLGKAAGIGNPRQGNGEQLSNMDTKQTLLTATLVGILSAGACSFAVTLGTQQVLKNTCTPISDDQLKQRAALANHSDTQRMLQAQIDLQKSIVNGCQAKGGIPVQNVQNGNIIDCKAGFGK